MSNMDRRAAEIAGGLAYLQERIYADKWERYAQECLSTGNYHICGSEMIWGERECHCITIPLGTVNLVTGTDRSEE